MVAGPFTCYICSDVFPAMHRHDHHKVPKALGGDDGPSNRVLLCPGCHSALHSVAYRLLSSKQSVAMIRADVDMIYGCVKASERCFELASLVRDAEVKVREGTADATGRLYSVTTTLRDSIKRLVALRSGALGMSQDAYLRSLVLADLRAHYPISADEEGSTRHARRRKRI